MPKQQQNVLMFSEDSAFLQDSENFHKYLIATEISCRINVLIAKEPLAERFVDIAYRNLQRAKRRLAMAKETRKAIERENAAYEHSQRLVEFDRAIDRQDKIRLELDDLYARRAALSTTFDEDTLRQLKIDVLHSIESFNIGTLHAVVNVKP